MITLFTILVMGSVQADVQLGPIFKVEGTASQPFGLAPAGYMNYDKDGFYLEGYSKLSSIPYVLPGPADSWAGSRPHADTFNFGLTNLDSLASGTNFHLLLKFKDAQNSIPPQFKVEINGAPLQNQFFGTGPGGGDQSLTGDFSKAHVQSFDISIPSTYFKAGNNSLAVATTKGSWAIWGSIELDGPDGTGAPLQNEFILGPTTSDPVVLRTPKGPRQPIDVQSLNIGPALSAKLKLVIDGKTVDESSASLPTGHSSTRLYAPWSKSSRNVQVVCTTSASTSYLSSNLPGVQPWTVELFPHAHLDVGYTNTQAEVSLIQRRNLLWALQLHNQYKSNPKDSLYHYNFEGTWILQQLLAKNTAAQIAEVKKGLQDGVLSCSAAEANELTGLMGDEEMMESYRLGILTGRKFGVHFPVATQTDVPGVTWGVVSALVAANVKALILMPNPGDRLGDVIRDWQDKPFWWESEDGHSRVLVWETVSYGMAHGMRPWNGERDHIFTTAHPTERFIGGYVFPRIKQLEAENYPYRILGLPWSDTDNSPVDGDVPVAAKAWNAKYVWPRVVTTTWAGAVNDMETQYGSKLPVKRGDLSPYWEDGAGSTAKETALNRNASNRMIAAEALTAMRDPHLYKTDSFMDAWRNIVLFSEHTWGSYNSVSEPNSPFTKEVWAGKKKFATDADKESHALLNQALAGHTSGLRAKAVGSAVGGLIDVWNPTGWTRSGDVVVPAGLAKGAKGAVTFPGGHPLLAQLNGQGDLVVRVENVPSYGGVRIKVVARPAAGHLGQQAWASGYTLQNKYLSAVIDPNTGAVKSLVDRTTGTDLVFTREAELGQYFYLLGGNTKDLQTVSNVRVTASGPGALEAKLTVKADAPGCKSLEAVYSLAANSRTLNLKISLQKLPVLDKESVHIAFPFAIEGGVMRVDLPWSVIIPEKDQMKGANRNWLTTNRFVDVSNQKMGVTVTSLDAPLIEVGGITATVMGGGGASSDWIHHLDPSQTFYSWALNNIWYTNYKADQSGMLTFRYAINVHGAWNGSRAFESGADALMPMVATAASPGGSLGSLGSLVKLVGSGADIECVKPTDDHRGLIVRLWGSSGHTAKVRLVYGRGRAHFSLSNLTQKKLSSLPNGVVTVPGYGVVTVLIEPSK